MQPAAHFHAFSPSRLARLTVGLLVGASVLCGPLASAQVVPPPPQIAGDAAVTSGGMDNMLLAALNILRDIDNGQLATVWETASPQLRSRLEQGAFVQSVEQRRQAMGLFRSREWRSIERLNLRDLPRVPDGRYFNLVFDASFSNQPQARELLTFRLDPDGIWRLVGYAINPSAQPSAGALAR